MTVQDEQGQALSGRFDPRNAMHALLEAVLRMLAALWSRWGALVSALSIVGFLAVVLAIDWLRPEHNWDTLAYLGVVARDWLGMMSAADIHAYAYDTVRNAVEPDQYAILTQIDAYRERMAADPDAFVSMLGMYDVKWLYVALLAWLGPVFGAYQAGYAINVFAAALVSAGLIWWFHSVRMLQYGFIATALMIIMTVTGFAMVDIPDFLGFALLVTGVLALDRGRDIVGLVLLFVSVLVRPDTAAVMGVLMAMAWFWRDSLTPKAAIAFLVSFVAYFAIKQAGTYPGWWVHAWFTAYRMENTLDGFHPDFSLKIYLIGFVWQLVRAALENVWLGMLALALFGWALMQGAGIRLVRRRLVLVSSMLIGIAAKFVVFPVHDTRFYVALLLPAILLLIAGARDGFRELAGRDPATAA